MLCGSFDGCAIMLACFGAVLALEMFVSCEVFLGRKGLDGVCWMLGGHVGAMRWVGAWGDVLEMG